MCHTDLHAAHGDWPVKPKVPVIPGHEGVGLVDQVGEGVTSLKVGVRVGVPRLFKACGECEYCLAGQFLVIFRHFFVFSSRIFGNTIRGFSHTFV